MVSRARRKTRSVSDCVVVLCPLVLLIRILEDRFVRSDLTKIITNGFARKRGKNNNNISHTLDSAVK